MPPDHPPFSDYRSLITIAARAPGRTASTRRSPLASLYTTSDSEDRLGWNALVLGGLFITLNLVGAIWAINHSRTQNHPLQLISAQAEPAVEPTQVAAPASRAKRSDVTYSKTVIEGPTTRGAQAVAASPLGWNDLTLMVRTGLTDEEIIAAAAGKQLTTVVGPEQVRMLREMGAGNRLISYLQAQLVYDAPASAPARVRATARPVSPVPTSYVPAATPYPTVDYAARDRQVASLKKQIDALDDQIRIARSRPDGYAYAGKRYYWSGDMSRQQSADGYIKNLEEQRDDLRRQKWQLEGR